MAGMNPKNIPKPVDGNPFELIGEIFQGDKDENNKSKELPSEVKEDQEKLRYESIGRGRVPDMIPSIERQIRKRGDGKFITHPTLVAIEKNASGKKNVYMYAELMHIDQLADGRYIIPMRSRLENARFGPTEYQILDCSKNTTFGLEHWRTNTFNKLGYFDHSEKPKNLISTQGKVVDTLLYFVCGFNLKDSRYSGGQETLYFMGFEEQKRQYFGYKTDNLQKVSGSGLTGIYQFEFGLIEMFNGPPRVMKNRGWSQFNCAELWVKNGNKKYILGNNNANNPYFEYPIKKMCKIVQNQPHLIKSIAKPSVRNIEKPRSSGPSKPSVKDAKKECEEIGFKPKTEKFGECVLSLSE